MLQQTRVATVIPYFNRFIQEFPTVERLGAAPLERVLEVWAGLGYYRRARMLHEAARQVVERFSCEFPQTYEQARTLPGVGDYTARAVLSIAYNQPYAVLDGNVARVMARLRARRGDLHQAPFRHAVEQDLEPFLSRRQPGSFNQALMELGQTVCLARRPLCPACPLRRDCLAYRSGEAEAFPDPRPRRAREQHCLASAILRRNGRVALVRGLADGLLSDLWNFPSAFGRSQQNARRTLKKKLGSLVPHPIHLGKAMAEVNHSITHRSIRVHLYPAELDGNRRGYDGTAPTQKTRKSLGIGRWRSIRWLPLSRLKEAAVSRLARKTALALP